MTVSVIKIQDPEGRLRIHCPFTGTPVDGPRPSPHLFFVHYGGSGSYDRVSAQARQTLVDPGDLGPEQVLQTIEGTDFLLFVVDGGWNGVNSYAFQSQATRDLRESAEHAHIDRFDFPLADLKITLSYGSSMAGPRVERIEIHGTGDVVVRSGDPCEPLHERRLGVPPDRVFELFLHAWDEGFFEMDDKYAPAHQVDLVDGRVVSDNSMWTDCAGMTVEIVAGLETKDVFVYQRGPERLSRIENKIREMAQLSNEDEHEDEHD